MQRLPCGCSETMRCGLAWDWLDSFAAARQKGDREQKNRIIRAYTVHIAALHPAWPPGTEAWPMWDAAAECDPRGRGICSFHEAQSRICQAPATHCVLRAWNQQGWTATMPTPLDDTAGLNARTTQQTPEFCAEHAEIVAERRNATETPTRQETL